MKHENYEILNLIGYGLAKFDTKFVVSMGFQNKQEFYSYLVSLSVAERESIIKNRQDLFDPFFENTRKGWWQKGNAYIHRKHLIDSYFGNLSVEEYSDMIKFKLAEGFQAIFTEKIAPIISSKFRQMQSTGREAEEYFLCNYKSIDLFSHGEIEDARFYGDGYDFQITIDNHFYLAEVKGIRQQKGAIRLTKNEYTQAQEFQDDYVLTIISQLETTPKMTLIPNPLKEISFEQKIITSKESLEYHSSSLVW
ncbi:MAG: DUF3883 domain-containing protein [Brevinema sp.]